MTLVVSVLTALKALDICSSYKINQVFTAYPTKGYLNLFHPRVLGLGA